MTILPVSKKCVKEAMKLPELAGLKRIGHGWFSQVFDRGDTVMKLTCDKTQYSFYTGKGRPQGESFPTLVSDYGQVGTNDDLPLYLVEMEKLDRIKYRTDAWGVRKSLIDIANEHYSRLFWDFLYLDGPRFERELSIAILTETITDGRVPDWMSECLRKVFRFLVESECVIDFHNENFMLRGDVIVFNDVVADVKTIYDRKCM